MKKAKLPNGEILQFPAETPDSVIDDTVKRHLAEKLAANAGIGKVMNNDFMKFIGGAFESIIDVAVRRYLSNSKGDTGERGPQGKQGVKGDKGEKGDKGDKGDRGETGAEGKRGQRGEKGDKGDRGERGLTGDRGEKGEKGDRGERGERGEQGPKGDKGERGERGADGGIGPAGGRGRPGAFWRGSWTAGVSYNDYDAVEYLGSSYVCTASNVTTAPPGPNWQLVAQGGAGGGGNPFDQSLNTSDSPSFVGLGISGGALTSDGSTLYLNGIRLVKDGDSISQLDGGSNVLYAGSYISDLFNNVGYITAAEVPAQQVNADWNSGSGPTEILNKPIIPTTTDGLTEGSTNLYFTNARAVSAVTWTTLTGKPTFATVATSGSAADLTGTLADARLSSNVSLDNQNNNFTAGQTITAAANTSALTASYSVTGTNTTALVNLTGTWNTSGIANGILLNITDTASSGTSRLLDLQTGGTSRFRVDKFGIVTGATFSGTSYNASSSFVINGTTTLTQDANYILAQRAGTNSQIFRIYNTYTDASNYERAFMRWNANVLEIGTEAAGTGTNRAMVLYWNGSNRLAISSAGMSVQGNTAFRITSGSVFRLEAPSAPASATATGTTGDIQWDANFIYVCTATSTWKRAALSTW